MIDRAADVGDLVGDEAAEHVADAPDAKLTMMSPITIVMTMRPMPPCVAFRIPSSMSALILVLTPRVPRRRRAYLAPAPPLHRRARGVIRPARAQHESESR